MATVLEPEQIDIIYYELTNYLINRLDEDYIQKGKDYDDFFKEYPRLKKPIRKKIQYEREKIMIISSRSESLLKKDIQSACKKILDENKTHQINLYNENYTHFTFVKTSDVLKKKFDRKELLARSTYSAAIILKEGSKDKNPALFELIDILQKYDKFYPPVIIKTKLDEKNIKSAIEETLLFAHKKNLSSNSTKWKWYSYVDWIMKDINSKISTLSRSGTEEELNAYLTGLGMKEFHSDSLSVFEKSKIAIIGKSDISKNDIEAVIASCNLDIDDFEFNLEYKDSSFDIADYKYSSATSELLLGPMPHSQKGKEKASSVISLIEQNPQCYPHLVKLKDLSGKLKITKDSLTRGLKETYLYKKKNGIKS